MTTTSGIFFDADSLRLAVEAFGGRLHFRLSVDGPWGHDNWAPHSKNGDVLETFLKFRQRHARVSLEVNWCHKPSVRNNELLCNYKKRCRLEAVDFCLSYAADQTSSPPRWGEVVIPWDVGLGHHELNDLVFNHCAIPNDAAGNQMYQVQVAPEGIYYLCKCSATTLAVGKVGGLGAGRLKSEVNALWRRLGSFGRLMKSGGVMEVARELLMTEAHDQVSALLARPYARTGGGCELCLKLMPYFLERNQTHDGHRTPLAQSLIDPHA